MVSKPFFSLKLEAFSFIDGNRGSSHSATFNPSNVNLPKSSPITFSHSLYACLDEHNYLPWYYQAFTVIKGNRLQKHLDLGVTPPKFITNKDWLANRMCFEYEDWDQQDNILVSWLLFSMSEKILTRMVGCDTVARILSNLLEYYTSLNRANIGKGETQLKNSRMQGSLRDFSLKIESLVYLLASIGHPISGQDHIEAIFNGLSSDCNIFVTSANKRLDAYSVAKIEAFLMA
ncbi:hypothetical protein CsatB_012053 [Cannabis sativa]